MLDAAERPFFTEDERCPIPHCPWKSTSAKSRWLEEQHDFELLDCREPVERNIAGIEPSRFLPMSEMMARIGELDALKERRLVVYCHHGVRSYQVAAWLRQQGFVEAQSMTGGIDAWSVEVDPKTPRY